MPHALGSRPQGFLAAGVSGKLTARAFVSVLILAAAAHARAEDKANVQVLKAAPARAGCVIGPELVFRSEREVGRPFEKVCRIEASVSALLTFVDLTGKAVEKARTLACTCGADALVVGYNSSEHTARKYVSVEVGSTTVTRGKRKFEEVVAFGIRFVEKPKPRPTPLKDGFRDFAWGAAVPTDFVLAEKRPPVTFFTHPSDSLHVGPATAERIEYGFLDGARLAHVTLTFPPSEEVSLVGFLTTMWGEPDAVSKDGSRSWGRPDEGTVVRLSVAEEKVVATIASRALVEEILRAVKEKAAKDAGL